MNIPFPTEVHKCTGSGNLLIYKLGIGHCSQGGDSQKPRPGIGGHPMAEIHEGIRAGSSEGSGHDWWNSWGSTIVWKPWRVPCSLCHGRGCVYKSGPT